MYEALHEVGVLSYLQSIDFLLKKRTGSCKNSKQDCEELSVYG
jgi:hypothetical protein